MRLQKLGGGGCTSISRNSCILVSGRELNVCPDVCPRLNKTAEENYMLQEKVTSELATKISWVLSRTSFLFPFWKAKLSDAGGPSAGSP